MKKSSIQCSREWRESLHFKKQPIETVVYKNNVPQKMKKK
tara:strand:- start:174 stop:293 length:120 start_codon:yes stop_codon:yes gene_type:complete